MGEKGLMKWEQLCDWSRKPCLWTREKYFSVRYCRL